MNRQSIYVASENDPPTFANDHLVPPLPLPKLEETLERYYESLKPFGTTEELANSRKIIENFKNGIGKKLHAIIEEKAKREKNWIAQWWEDYAYHTLRIPLLPYCSMAQPLIIAGTGMEESREYSLKGTARLIYHSLELWHLIRTEKLKQATTPDKKTVFSSFLHRRFYNTVRIPGEIKDYIDCKFKTEKEGDCSANIIVIGRGRIFVFNGVNPDGTILRPQQLLTVFQEIRGAIDHGYDRPAVPILTCDDRSNWARNRKHIQELSQHNTNILGIIENSLTVINFDEHCPANYSECALKTVTGDFCSRWADASALFVSFANGKYGLIGEHSCYDGTISISYGIFILLSLIEQGEPDWLEKVQLVESPTELVFDLDDHLKNEIIRVGEETKQRATEITVICHQFGGFGKEYIKSQNLHPDSFVQMILQLAYYRLHEKFTATYETALMRFYYNGRTETVRSCSSEAVNFVLGMVNPKLSRDEKINLFKIAVNAQNRLMTEARSGKGIDRHLFGLWCAAYENNIDIPELYDDPLYSKSGGGGNFTLSTSTLGFSINNGFVAPMCTDGYGVFYTITTESIWVNITVYRESPTTSNLKFLDMFDRSLAEMKELLDNSVASKL